jgi:hypothetical protein
MCGVEAQEEVKLRKLDYKSLTTGLSECRPRARLDNLIDFASCQTSTASDVLHCLRNFVPSSFAAAISASNWSKSDQRS